MEIKHSTEISVERTRRFVIRQPEMDETLPCPGCGEMMLSAESSAILFRVKCRRVYQLVEADAVHFVETETGVLFVCPPSLDQAIRNAGDEPPTEIVKLLADSTAANPAVKTEIQGELL